MDGSLERLETAYRRAAAVADQAVGLWLARNSKESGPVDFPSGAPDESASDLQALRALARAAATAYARQLRAEGLPPERMLVLVKEATSHHGFPGFGAQELTNDIVRWSIEAYFDGEAASDRGGGNLSVEPNLDLSEFAEYADTLRGQRAENEKLVRHALRAVGDRYPARFVDEVRDITRAIDGTLGELDRAAEELRVQNEALLAARIDLEGTYLLFRDLFELAPSAYVVTTPDTRILYANEEACTLFGRRRNALAGKPLVCFVPLEDRSGFRSAVLRSASPGAISEWPATLLPSGAAANIKCRMRVRAVSAQSARISRALFWNIMEETDEDLF